MRGIPSTSGDICDDEDFDIASVRVVEVLVRIVSLDTEMDIVPRNRREVGVDFHDVDMVVSVHIIHLKPVERDGGAAHGRPKADTVVDVPSPGPGRDGNLAGAECDWQEQAPFR
jgi:hypothetical protein